MHWLPLWRHFSAVLALSNCFFFRSLRSASIARNSGLSLGTMGSPSSWQMAIGYKMMAKRHEKPWFIPWYRIDVYLYESLRIIHHFYNLSFWPQTHMKNQYRMSVLVIPRAISLWWILHGFMSHSVIDLTVPDGSWWFLMVPDVSWPIRCGSSESVSGSQYSQAL